MSGAAERAEVEEAVGVGIEDRLERGDRARDRDGVCDVPQVDPDGNGEHDMSVTLRDSATATVAVPAPSMPSAISFAP